MNGLLQGDEVTTHCPHLFCDLTLLSVLYPRFDRTRLSS
jgi:hypothetical protein